MSSITRRQFLSGLAGSVAFGSATTRRLAIATEGIRLTKPLPRQAAWQDLEVGAIYHFDMPLFAPGGRTNHNAIHETWDPKIYNGLFDAFKKANINIGRLEAQHEKPLFKRKEKTGEKDDESLK